MPTSSKPTERRKRRWPLAATALGVITLLVIAAFLVNSQRRRHQQSIFLKDVHRAMSRGDYGKASATVDRWRAAQPNEWESYYWKVRVALALDRVSEIEPAFQAARTHGAPEDQLEFLRALVAAKLKKYQEAEPSLRRAFQQDLGPDPQLDEALARVYLENFNIPNAIAVLERWARDQPENPTPYLWRAEVDSRSDSQLEALEADYREALKRDPKLAKARLGLANTLQKQHHNSEARTEFDAYLKLRPDDAVGHLGAGRVARALQDRDAADRHFAKALELDPRNAEARKEYADSALGRNEPETALEQIEKAIEIDPFEPNYHYTKALALKKIGREAEAKAESALVTKLREELDQLSTLRRQLVGHPDDVSLQIKIARWLFTHGQVQGGVDWAVKILRDHPNHPEANRLLAVHYDKTGNPGLANFYRLRAENATP